MSADPGIFSREAVVKVLDNAAESDEHSKTLIDQLDAALSADNLEQGIRLDFERNQRAFEQTIDIFGFDTLLQTGGLIHLHEAIVKKFPGKTVLGSNNVDPLRQLPIATALGAMQAAYWETAPGYMNQPNLQVPKVTSTSEIVVVHSKKDNEDGDSEEIYADTSKPGVIFRADYFAGAKLLEENGIVAEDVVGIPELIAGVEKRNRKERRVAEFANYLARNGLSLMMPHSTYSISIGEPRVVTDFVFNALGDVRTATRHVIR